MSYAHTCVIEMRAVGASKEGNVKLISSRQDFCILLRKGGSVVCIDGPHALHTHKKVQIRTMEIRRGKKGSF
jgi:hypothetical protein